LYLYKLKKLIHGEYIAFRKDGNQRFFNDFEDEKCWNDDSKGFLE
jgi:hypothetical protein